MSALEAVKRLVGYRRVPGQYGHVAVRIGMVRAVYSPRRDGYAAQLRVSWGKGAGCLERFGIPRIRRVGPCLFAVETVGVTARLRFGPARGYEVGRSPRRLVVTTKANAL